MRTRTDLAHNLVVLENAPACDKEGLVEIFGRISCVSDSFARRVRAQWLGRRTDIDGVVVPVCAGHVLVDVRVDARHYDRRSCCESTHLSSSRVCTVSWEGERGVIVLLESTGSWAMLS